MQVLQAQNKKLNINMNINIAVYKVNKKKSSITKYFVHGIMCWAGKIVDKFGHNILSDGTMSSIHIHFLFNQYYHHMTRLGKP